MNIPSRLLTFYSILYLRYILTWLQAEIRFSFVIHNLVNNDKVGWLCNNELSSSYDLWSIRGQTYRRHHHNYFLLQEILLIKAIFHIAVGLHSNRSQNTSKYGKNISDTLSCTMCATFLFLSVIYYCTEPRQHGIHLSKVCIVFKREFTFAVTELVLYTL